MSGLDCKVWIVFETVAYIDAAFAIPSDAIEYSRNRAHRNVDSVVTKFGNVIEQTPRCTAKA